MKAILLKNFGGTEELYLGNAQIPQLTENEVLVKVRATALNRADLLQRRGLYPPPPGESEILGLEMAGEVAAVGSAVAEWKPGDRAFALLAGGGYAEYVKVHREMLLPIPPKMDFEEAAAIAEAFLTAWQAVVWLGNLQAGEQVLIHAGASGVGTAAIQIAKSLGAEVTITASAGKHQPCKDLGADHCIDYRTEDFAEIISQREKPGVNLVIDFLGASYFSRNLKVLSMDGRMVMLGLMGGVKMENLNLSPILFKRLKIMGSTLRARSLDYKISLTKDFRERCLPMFESGKIKPVIDSIFDWSEVQAVHQRMEKNLNAGKIVLRVSD